ncbi:YbjQ family protein [Allokutzneria sp. A3M-2-11 16]|uniref:YbjQ family protein n=1 Tax=Allokutzneria sp. A3M-2-11 16 TaxID=2962043 RepID=UPI0020B75B7E|nr:YbjQ family protein [Allokutzneria sp. A3M-2-11 16]MCP3799014.1 YbjQ family protein [Allokutzneria sp. A3M-2-11 16]
MNQPMPPMPAPPPILVSTMNDVPGYRVVRVIGEVFGSTVRSRNAFSDIGASFKGMFGGEQAGYTKLLDDSRFEAIGRLKQNAASMGANAVLAMRFESGDIMPGSTEIAAYGTAVFIAPLNQQPGR